VIREAMAACAVRRLHNAVATRERVGRRGTWPIMARDLQTVKFRLSG
jgi:hypothetical protein